MGFLSSFRLPFFRARSRQGPLLVGLVGTGVAMERIHVPTIRKMGSKFRIFGCCSGSPEGARQFAAEHDIEHSYRDIDEMLADPKIDVAVVAVPLNLNASIAEKVLRARKHLLIEKPLATSPHQARSVAALAQSVGTVAMVAENVLYWPVLDSVKAQLENQTIGTPSLVSWNSIQHVSEASLPGWRSQPSYPFGYLLESGVHLIAALRFLFGNLQIVDAHSEAIYPSLGNGDFMTVTLSNGGTLRIVITFIRTPFEHSVNENRCTIVGSEGKILFSSNRCLVRAVDTERDSTFSGDLGYQAEYDDLFRAVREGISPRSTLERACDDLDLLWRALTWRENKSD